MEIYVVQINEVKLAYSSLELAQSALERFLQNNPEKRLPDNKGEYCFKIYPVNLMASNYTALLVNKKTKERSFLGSDFELTLEEFRTFLKGNFEKDYSIDIIPNFYF